MDISRATYASYSKDRFGWIESKDKPQSFDLISMVTDSHKTRIGWWTGSSWFGIKLKEGEKIIKWKKKAENHCL